ncbi:preprotein translocase subunit SecB [Natronospira proteinivora]|uniref:Protein-export protein SecB n=1 Tax=Natronospira proteinivora TaxID=1807133 RepID=A0ABT1GCK6_9GAMM|nr:protein-export chaperone SecB [Natronospira proteinivora]MCP1728103.1 preprotein translocase subunit SecB [Natronospira proteinivora]
MAEDKQDNANNQAGGQDAAASKDVQLHNIYVKDFSFESPQAPQIFTQQVTPEFSMNMGNRAAQVAESLYEVTLNIEVEARHEDKAVFLIELQQSGLFQLDGFTGEEKEAVLGAFCPAQLYPYAREVITTMVTNGGFPAPRLQPVNFDLLRHRQKEQQQAAAQESGGQA